MKTTLFTICLILGVISLSHESAAATRGIASRMARSLPASCNRNPWATHRTEASSHGCHPAYHPGVAIRCRCLIHSRQQNMEPRKKTLSLMRMFLAEEMVSSFQRFVLAQLISAETFAWLICDMDVTRDRGLCL